MIFFNAFLEVGKARGVRAGICARSQGRSPFSVRRSLFAVRCRRLWVLCLTQISSLKFRPRARRPARPRGTTMRRTIPELNFGFRRLRLTEIQLRLTKDCHSRFSCPKTWPRNTCSGITYQSFTPNLRRPFRPNCNSIDGLRPNLFRRLPLPSEAGFGAAEAFQRYRQRGGDKRSPLPDFYIGAHAEVESMVLITHDQTRYETYFPNAKLRSPPCKSS
jgi:hypothetical protein